MPELPFQATDISDANELFRILFEDRIGGYDKDTLIANRMLGLDSEKNVVTTDITGEDFVYYAGKR